MAGLPSGRGRKGGVPRRKRSLKKDVALEHVKLRQATVGTSGNMGSKSPDSIPVLIPSTIQSLVRTSVAQTNAPTSAGNVVLPSLQVRPSLFSTSPNASVVLQGHSSGIQSGFSVRAQVLQLVRWCQLHCKICHSNKKCSLNTMLVQQSSC